MNKTDLRKLINRTVFSNKSGIINGNELNDVLTEIVDSYNKAEDEYTEGSVVIINPDGVFVESGYTIQEVIDKPGVQGVTGLQGVTGVRGPKGDKGERGEKGDRGDFGAIGAQGPTGPQGVQGPTGPQGATGIPGGAGLRGPQGLQGVTGERGPQGVHGLRGPQGVTGLRGPKGEAGIEYTAGNGITIVDNVISVTEKPTQTEGGTVLNNYGNNNNIAAGNFSLATGYKCETATGEQGANSFVGGAYCKASNADCIVYGNKLDTCNHYEAVFGRYNNYPKFRTWTNKPLFEVGDGFVDENNNIVYRTILMAQEIDGQVFVNKSIKTENMGDFAEYFEWADGNPNNEDRVGYMVQLNEDKIELAQSIDNCIGVISSTASFVSDSASMDWQGKFIHDEWGREIKDKNGNPVVNPEYDENKTYIPRMYRKEWSPVGLIGKVLVRQDGTLISGGFASCINGIATNSDSGYRVIKVLSDKIAIILIK